MAKTKSDITASLERNRVLEKELFFVKTELEKAINWNTPSQILTTFISQESSGGRGLEYNSQEDRPSFWVSHARRKIMSYVFIMERMVTLRIYVTPKLKF